MSAILSNVFYVSIFATVFLSLVSDQIQDLNGVDLSRSVDPDNPTTADPIEVRKTDGWGLPDVAVPYGSLFQYTLPKQDEFGLFLNYKVSSVDEEDLPKWLYWNAGTRTLEGVAGRDMLWEVQNMQVRAEYQLHDGSTKTVTEYFTIRITNGKETNQNKPFGVVSSTNEPETRLIECLPEAAVTKATVIFDSDSEHLSPRERIDLLRRLCSYLKLDTKTVKLLPLGSKQILDASALVAGPGDVKQSIHADPLTVQWLVGCGNVYASQMPILLLLELSSVNGSMSDAIGHGVVGWYITNSRENSFKTASRHKRHYYNPTATPVPSVVRPTSIPVPTRTVSDEVEFPGTRVFPTIASSESIEPTWSASDIKTTLIYIQPTISVVPEPTRSVVPEPTSLVTESKRTRKLTTEMPPSSTWSVDTIEPSVGYLTTADTTTATEMLPVLTTAADAGMKRTPKVKTSPRPTTDPSTAKSVTSKMTKKPHKTPKPTIEASVVPVSTEASTEVKPPTVVVSLGRLPVAEVGAVFQYKIPNETFYDERDGGTRSLKLKLLATDNTNLPPTSWVQLNETTQTLFGFPLEENSGSHDFILMAANSDNKIAKTSFEIVVQDRPALHKISHEFSATLDLDYQMFLYDAQKRIDVTNKIAKAFGDADASNMVVTRIASGSVILTWTNSSLPEDPCPEKEIAELLKRFIHPNGSINENFKEAIKPYRILDAKAEATGSCSDIVLPSSGGDTLTTPETDGPAAPVVTRQKHESSMLLYIIIPFIAIAILILIFVVICLVCCRRRRKQQEETDKFDGLHKGIPIIFADELDDRPDTPKSTLRSRRSDDDDKPASIPPPEYPRSKPGSQSSTLHSDYKEPLISDDEGNGGSEDLDKTLPSTAKLIQNTDEKPTTNQNTPDLLS